MSLRFFMYCAERSYRRRLDYFGKYGRMDQSRAHRMEFGATKLNAHETQRPAHIHN